MSFDSSYDTKEQVRQATDLVDLVGRSVQLRRQGRMYVGICPWHDDSRPSLQVNPERQSWKCWVCDVGGDIFSFVMKREGVDFPTALRMLAERAGIELSRHAARKTQPGSPEDKPTLYRALAWTEQQMHQCLLHSPEAAPVRAYLQQRGLSDESIHQFQLGFSPDRWQWLLDRAGSTEFTTAILEAAGLVLRTRDGQRHYDRFRGRLIFPIRDTEDRPIAFGGRILPELAKDDSPKYINSPETRVFVKSDHLYGLNLVRNATARDRHIVVVEGYTDVIMAHQCGVQHVAAVLGTALGASHLKLLRRFADRITLVLDGDAAGQRRTNEILELFVAEQIDLRILTLPSGLDPFDFLRSHGGEAFRDLLGQAVDAMEHKVQVATRGIDLLQAPDQANRALEEILKTMAGASRVSTATPEATQLRHQQLLARLANQFRVDETALRDRLVQLRQQTRRRVPARDNVAGSPQGAPAATGQGSLTPLERELFEILTLHPRLVPDTLKTLSRDLFQNGQASQLWTLLVSLQDQQIEITFENMLTVSEDPQLKSLLVELDEQARTKDSLALEDVEARLIGLIRSFDLQKQCIAQREVLATLETRHYDEKEELDILEQLIQRERERQGISAPTDG